LQSLQAEAGHDVHVLYSASKAQLLFAAMQNGCMPQLTYSQAVEGQALWQQGNVTHHVALTDAEQSVADQLSNAFAGMGATAGSSSTMAPVVPPVMQRLMDEATYLAKSSSNSSSSNAHQQQQQQQRCWVIIDADGSQEPLAPGCASLFEAAVHYLNAPTAPPSHNSSSRVLLLVQNIHFLPLGDQGTAARRPGLLAAWGAVAGVACVSSFVAHYVAQHAGLLGLQPQRIRVVHCATWRSFGRGPFEDCGAAHAVHAPWQGMVSSSAHCSSDCSQQQQQQRKPVVGCLKVTPEKGGLLFLALAAQMPGVNFLGVCADAALLQAAAAAGLPNLRLVPPVADVGQILQHMVLVLAPSVWQEALGMVVVDALARGVPVIVSDQGGLAEAAMGAAAGVVPVQPMVLPLEQQHQQQQQQHVHGEGFRSEKSEAAPNWQQRVFPEQPLHVVHAWAAAVAEMLSSRERYEAASRAGRAATIGLLEKQPQLLQEFLEWLQQL
jgi:glycosyltransferase involved in cell wall biosynthesis